MKSGARPVPTGEDRGRSQSASESRRHVFRSSPPAAKRAADVLASLLLLPFALILVAAAAIAIVVADRRAPFYLDTRVGWRARKFRCLKLQTMSRDRRKFEDYLRDHPDEAARYSLERKVSHDPRVSRLGNLLRRSSLDEVPQLLNVLAGQMSIVGPRPLSPAEFEMRGHRREQLARFRPGLTGLWQVSGRSNLSMRRRRALDHFYVTRWRPRLDLYVLLMTPVAVLRARGAS